MGPHGGYHGDKPLTNHCKRGESHVGGRANRLRFVNVFHASPQATHRFPTGPVMADYREIKEIQKDPARARSLARSLSTLRDMEWTDWELDFLASIGACRKDLSTRQGEKLIELRDQSFWYTAVDGFSLTTLIERCTLYRDELADHDCAFIAQLEETGATRLRCKHARRLLRCARALGEIEPHHGHSLDRADTA